MNSAQLAKRERIVGFVLQLVPVQQQITRHFFLQFPQPYQNRFYSSQALPTSEKFAQDLLADAEFRLLGLGTWLETTNGELISEAVGLVISPIYHSEYEFLVKGLKMAADAQYQEGQQVAGRIALGVVGVGSLALLFHHSGGMKSMARALTSI